MREADRPFLFAVDSALPRRYNRRQMIRWFRRYRYGALGALIGTIAGQVVALLLNLQILAFVGAVIGTAIGTFLDERIGRKLTH